MSQTASSRSSEALEIRSPPASGRRFSRKALAVLLGGAAFLVLGSFAIAMNPAHKDTGNAQRELYSTTNKPKADGLASLPVTYADVPQETDVPILGPRLPGDLGEPFLQAHREGRINLDDRMTHAPAVIDDAASEASAIANAKAIEARTSGLFFAGQTRPIDIGIVDASTLSAGRAGRDPFEVLNLAHPGLVNGGIGDDPNRQGRKQDFVSGQSDASIYNPHRLEIPISPWQIMAGTIIPATLLTGINSDLPGQVIAQVTEPVYDTVTGNAVLIPQGSRVVGRYDSVIAYGQSRALIVWHRIIMPDGSSIRIENLPAVDGRGNAGLKDRVNSHTLRIFSAAALSSLISIGAELGNDDDRIARALRDATQNGASRVGEEVVRRQLAVQPTITIRPGWRLRILVHQDIILRPYGDQ